MSENNIPTKDGYYWAQRVSIGDYEWIIVLVEIDTKDKVNVFEFGTTDSFPADGYNWGKEITQ